MLDVYASFPHYADHLLPIWRVLDARHWPISGPYTLRGDQNWGTPRPDPRIATTAPVASLVAGWVDALIYAPEGRPLVYLEHGAGQTYAGHPEAACHDSYSGGSGLQNVRLFLVPNETVAARRRELYPGTAIAVVGCPKLDRWHVPDMRIERARLDLPPAVAFTWHFDAGDVAPEATWAWPHYRIELGHVVHELQRQGLRVIGHAHPRAQRFVRELCIAVGLEWCDHLDDVFAEASVLVGDNTSALYEFASLGRPVVCMNAPWYRRDVEHGLRFWSHVPGLQVDGPGELVDVVLEALADPAHAVEMRRAAVAEVYAFTDGRCAERAADAIEEALWR